MCALDTERADVWVETPRTARKGHVCDGCHTIIHPREAYNEVRYVFDRSAGTERECFGCWVVRREFGDAHRMYPMPSNLLDDLRECHYLGSAKQRRVWHSQDIVSWRDELASVLRRYRLSATNRTHLAWLWMRRALDRQLRLTRLVVRSRNPPMPQQNGTTWHTQ